MTKILRTALFAALALTLNATAGSLRAQGEIKPIFGTPNGVDKVNELVRRVTIELGESTLDTKKISEQLDKGFQFTPPGANTLGNQQAQKPGDGIQLAGGGEKDKIIPAIPAQNGNGNGNIDGFKGTIDAINGIFKMQADAIRSIDMKSVRLMPNPEGGQIAIGADNGRVGFMLVNLPPEVGAQLKLPPELGLLVKEVFVKTPAEAAGYKKNDILISFGGRDVPSNVNDFMDKNFRFVKNDTPIAGVVIRAGEKVTIDTLKITDRRVVPALPNETAPDYTHLIQIAPGINSILPNTVRIPEVRTVPRGGGISDIIIVDPNGKR